MSHKDSYLLSLDFPAGEALFIYPLLSLFIHILPCRQSQYSSLGLLSIYTIVHWQHTFKLQWDPPASQTPAYDCGILRCWDRKQHYAMTTAGPALDVMSATVTGGFRSSAGYRQASLSPWQDLSLGEKPPLSRRSGSLTSVPLCMLFTFRSWHPDKHGDLTGRSGLEAGIDMAEGGWNTLGSAKNWRREVQTYWPQGQLRLATVLHLRIEENMFGMTVSWWTFSIIRSITMNRVCCFCLTACTYIFNQFWFIIQIFWQRSVQKHVSASE